MMQKNDYQKLAHINGTLIGMKMTFVGENKTLDEAIQYSYELLAKAAHQQTISDLPEVGVHSDNGGTTSATSGD
jgi:hypothetical protein